MNIKDFPAKGEPLATPSQKEYLGTLAEQLDQDPEDLAQEYYRKGLDELTVTQAGELIESLKQDLENKRARRRRW